MRRVPVEVRRATTDDVDDVLELWGRARDELDRAGRHTPATAHIGDRLRQAVADGEAEALVARWDGRPAGYVWPAGGASSREPCLIARPPMRPHCFGVCPAGLGPRRLPT